MFKKTEESEWTRFSKALGSKDQPREAEETAGAEEDLLDAQTTVSPPAPVQSGPGPSPAPEPATPASLRPLSSDVNVGLNRPAAPAPLPQTPLARPVAPVGHAALLQDDGESVIGEGTTVDGSFRSEHSIRIRGTVQGEEVESKRRVVVEAEAKVSAKISAQEITIAGEVNGELTCPGRVEITPTGRVTGAISAGTLIMQEGAYFEGHMKMLNAGGQRETEASRTPVDVGVS
ncbi:MAG TPA: polymer-forming cytoskeletal protein [Chloroflexota bacterium]|nr:polymer-forming cytoskeletal protein [Chloroflexota bacterium]